jgi:hypothetical protein
MPPEALFEFKLIKLSVKINCPDIIRLKTVKTPLAIREKTSPPLGSFPLRGREKLLTYI